MSHNLPAYQIFLRKCIDTIDLSPERKKLAILLASFCTFA